MKRSTFSSVRSAGKLWICGGVATFPITRRRATNPFQCNDLRQRESESTELFGESYSTLLHLLPRTRHPASGGTYSARKGLRVKISLKGVRVITSRCGRRPQRRGNMLKRAKRTLIVAAGAAALIAAPASAGTVITYHAPNSAIVGYEIYNDCGVLIYQTGITTPYVMTTWQPIPC
jgi:hypothetical protein